MLSLVLLLFSASNPDVHGPSKQHSEEIQNYHQQLAETQDFEFRTAPRKLRAYAEYENAHYLLTSSATTWASQEIKEIVARNLPEGIQFVVLAGNNTEAEESRKFYSQWLSSSQLKIFVIEGGSGFWARDSLPIPSFTADNQLHLTDARYYNYYEPDDEVFKIFQSRHSKHDYFFEGGNLLADQSGRCFVVENIRVKKMPDEVFINHYGCKKVYRLPHETGIGHVDERIKIVKDGLAFTDSNFYKEVLEELGYEVILLPRTGEYLETYANSLLLKDRIFVPQFNRLQDREAMDAYESVGLTAIPFPSSYISNNGRGSLHCITMIYPYTPLTRLAESLEAIGY